MDIPYQHTGKSRVACGISLIRIRLRRWCCHLYERWTIVQILKQTKKAGFCKGTQLSSSILNLVWLWFRLHDHSFIVLHQVVEIRA